MCADETNINSVEPNDSGDQHSNKVVPITGSAASGAGVTVHVDHIETTRMTDEQYQLAVTALAELINQWKQTHRRKSDDDDPAA